MKLFFYRITWGRSPVAVPVLCLILLAGCAAFSSSDAKRGDQHLAAGQWEEAKIGIAHV